MKTIRRNFTAERADDGFVTLSTETPCPQDGLILAAKGWDLSRFAKVPPKMFFNHSTWGTDDFPIGRWEDVQVKDGKLVGRPVFAAEEHPERAGVVAKLWDGGFLDDVSVSFRVNSDSLSGPVEHDGRKFMVSMSHELLECSIVGIGADPNAGKGRIAEAVTRGVITEEEARGFEPDPPAPDPIIALTEQVHTLRDALEAAQSNVDRLTVEVAALRERDAQAEGTDGQPAPDPDPPSGDAVLRIAEPEEARVRVDPDHITAAVQRTIGHHVGSAVKRALDLASGRLPD